MIVHISAPICDAVQALHLTIPYATLAQVLWALEASEAFSSAMEEVEAKQDAKEDKKVSQVSVVTVRGSVGWQQVVVGKLAD